MFCQFRDQRLLLYLAFRSLSIVQYFHFRIQIFVLQQNDRYDKSDIMKGALIKKQFYEIHIFWTAQSMIPSYPFIFASHSSPSWPLCSIINPSALPLSVLKLMKTKTCFKICSLLTQNQVSISLSADFDVFKKKLGWKKELKVL